MNDYRNQVAYAQQQARFQKKMNEFEVQRVEIRALTDERNELADAQNKVNDLPESK